MADKLTPEHRSWNMSHILSKNTTQEKVVRSILHRMGYHFSQPRRLICNLAIGKTYPSPR